MKILIKSFFSGALILAIIFATSCAAQKASNTSTTEEHSINSTTSNTTIETTAKHIENDSTYKPNIAARTALISPTMEVQQINGYTIIFDEGLLVYASDGTTEVEYKYKMLYNEIEDVDEWCVIQRIENGIATDIEYEIVRRQNWHSHKISKVTTNGKSIKYIYGIANDRWKGTRDENIEAIGFVYEGAEYTYKYTTDSGDGSSDYIGSILDENGNEVAKYLYKTNEQDERGHEILADVLGKDENGEWVSKLNDKNFIGNINRFAHSDNYREIDFLMYYDQYRFIDWASLSSFYQKNYNYAKTRLTNPTDQADQTNQLKTQPKDGYTFVFDNDTLVSVTSSETAIEYKYETLYNDKQKTEQKLLTQKIENGVVTDIEYELVYSQKEYSYRISKVTTDGEAIQYKYGISKDSKNTIRATGFIYDGAEYTYRYSDDYQFLDHISLVMDSNNNAVAKYKYKEHWQWGITLIDVLGKDESGEWVSKINDNSFIGNINRLIYRDIYREIDFVLYYNKGSFVTWFSY